MLVMGRTINFGKNVLKIKATWAPLTILTDTTVTIMKTCGPPPIKVLFSCMSIGSSLVVSRSSPEIISNYTSLKVLQHINKNILRYAIVNDLEPPSVFKTSMKTVRKMIVDYYNF